MSVGAQMLSPQAVLRVTLHRGSGADPEKAAGEVDAGYARLVELAAEGHGLRPEGMLLSAKFEWDVVPVAVLLARRRPGVFMRVKFWYGTS